MIESEDLEPRKIELDRNLGTDPFQTQERITGNNYQNPTSEDMDELGKIGEKQSYIQSQMHFDYDPAESIADSDPEDGELRRMLASPLFLRGRGDSESFRKSTVYGKPEPALIEKRGASAKRTEAHHSRRESLTSSSSQEPSASGNLLQCFHRRATNRETSLRVLFLM